jgi:hypothetical protein
VSFPHRPPVNLCDVNRLTLNCAVLIASVRLSALDPEFRICLTPEFDNREDKSRVKTGAQILRLANNALVQNVLLGPWIHVGSKVRNHTAVRVGQQLTLRSKITSNVVSKGHAIVEFDAIVVADGARTVAEITHAAIWRPRQAAENH